MYDKIKFFLGQEETKIAPGDIVGIEMTADKEVFLIFHRPSINQEIYLHEPGRKYSMGKSRQYFQLFFLTIQIISASTGLGFKLTSNPRFKNSCEFA